MASVDLYEAGRKIKMAIAFDIPDFRVSSAVRVNLRHRAETTFDGIVFAFAYV